VKHVLPNFRISSPVRRWHVTDQNQDKEVGICALIYIKETYILAAEQGVQL
jgi:hypothetical protein